MHTMSEEELDNLFFVLRRAVPTNGLKSLPEVQLLQLQCNRDTQQQKSVSCGQPQLNKLTITG